MKYQCHKNIENSAHSHWCKLNSIEETKSEFPLFLVESLALKLKLKLYFFCHSIYITMCERATYINIGNFEVKPTIPTGR